MKSSFCIDLQRFMLIPTKFPLNPENRFVTHLGQKLSTCKQKKSPMNNIFIGVCLCFVEVTGLEPATAWSQTRNATNCATPRCFI